MGGPDGRREHGKHTDDTDLVAELLDGDRATHRIPGTDGSAETGPSRKLRRRIGTVMLTIGALSAVLTVAYLADLVLAVGEVPRGTTVAGVDVGGLAPDDAEARLRADLAPLTSAPVPLRAGGVEVALDPGEAGLEVDWAATVDRAGPQPWNPADRVVSLFRSREIGLVTDVDGGALRIALRELATRHIDREPSPGRIEFRTVGRGELRPRVVDPVAGRSLGNLDAAAAAVRARWPTGTAIDLPVRTGDPPVPGWVLREFARGEIAPLVSGPVLLRGDGTDAVVLPSELKDALRVDLRARAGPAVTLDRGKLRAVLTGQLDGTQWPARDARLTVVDGAPSVQPSVEGTRIDWTRTLDRLVRAAATPGRRVVTVAYTPVPPSVTTADMEALGVIEVVSRFTTGGFVDAVRPNLRAVARAVDGTLVRPGAKFDLEERTGPRTRSRGYVLAPLREDGTGPATIGGGVNQFTSTLFNAVHRAGLADVERTPQPRHLDRYPAGRDAVSLAGDGSTVDFSFTNDAPTAVFLRALVGDSTVTVELWGTRR